MNPDTKSRTVRTVIQGLITTVVFAVIPILQASLSDGIDKVDWAVTAASAGTAALMTLLAYIMAELKPAA